MLKHLLIIVLSLKFLSCSTHEPKNLNIGSSILEQKYVSMIQGIQDANGFIDTKHCDSLMHTGLLSTHSSIEVDIRAAEGRPGEWFRRPLDYKECFKNNESRSTISRDMLLGVLYYAVYNKDLEILEDLVDFGTKRNWVMGSDNTGGFHTIMNTKMLSLLGRSIEYLGSESKLAYLPISFNANCEGFTCHLTALQIGLLAKINNSVSDKNLKVLKKLKNKNPNNLLYNTLYHKYADGNFSSVYKLMDKYPLDRLPNNTDWSDDWPPQRDDDDPGLLPGAQKKQHSGGEILFIFSILRDK